MIQLLITLSLAGYLWIKKQSGSYLFLCRRWLREKYMHWRLCSEVWPAVLEAQYDLEISNGKAGLAGFRVHWTGADGQNKLEPTKRFGPPFLLIFFT